MADNAELTPEVLKTLQQWIAQKSRGRPVECAVCGRSNWTVLNNYLMLKAVTENEDESDAVYPHVALSCVNCAHTIFINALKAGLWRQ